MNSSHIRRERRLQEGFNMLEVMVTLVVLSVGLLGMAALQATGIRFNHQSYQRTQAVFQAYDIIDRIRSNKLCRASMACTTYDSVSHLAGAPPSPPTCISASGASVCPATSDMATYDLSQWALANGRLLTQGRGAICRGTLTADATSFACTPPVSPTDNTYRIAIFWVENDLTMRVDMQVEL